MKNVITTLILILLVGAPVTAQKVNRPVLADNVDALPMNTHAVNRVHVKAMRDFIKRDKQAANVDWTVIDNGYVVKYSDAANHNCRTVYNCFGKFVYTIKQYAEAAMPRDVRGMVKSQYYDYTITLVEEIIEPFKPTVYIVHIQDAQTLKNVRVRERDMEVIEEYSKPSYK